MTFLAEHGGTILVGLVLLALVLAVVLHLVKNHRSGISSCGCGGGCAGCGKYNACNSHHAGTPTPVLEPHDSNTPRTTHK